MTTISHTQGLKQFLNLGTSMRNTTIVESKLREKTQNVDIINIVLDYYLLLTRTNFLRKEMYDFYVLNLSYKKIAKKYDIKSSSIRNIIYRETLRIQDVLGGYNIYQMWKDNTFTNANIGIIQVIIETTLANSDIEEKDFEAELALVSPKRKSKIDVSLAEDNNFLEGKLCVTPSEIVADRRFNTQVNENQFKQILQVITALSEKNQQQLVNKYDSRLWGYIDYLYKMPISSLTTTDKERKNLLMSSLAKM